MSFKKKRLRRIQAKITNKLVLKWGVDIDEVLRVWTESYNRVYTREFPHHKDLVRPIDKWDWFHDYKYDDLGLESFFSKYGLEITYTAKPYLGVAKHFEWFKKVIEDLNCEVLLLSKQVSEGEKEGTKEWLKKENINSDNLVLVNSFLDKWNYADIIIDDSPEVLNSKPSGKVSIKVLTSYNKDIPSDFTINKFTDIDTNLIFEAIELLEELELKL